MNEWQLIKMQNAPANPLQLEICNPKPGTCPAAAPRPNTESGQWRVSPAHVFGYWCKLVHHFTDFSQPRLMAWLLWEGMWARLLLISICKHGYMRVQNCLTVSYLEEWEICLRKMTFEKVTICLPVFPLPLSIHSKCLIHCPFSAFFFSYVSFSVSFCLKSI